MRGIKKCISCKKNFEPIRGNGECYGKKQFDGCKYCKNCNHIKTFNLKRNKIVIIGNKAKIIFNRGGFALIDAVDVNKVKDFTWYKGTTHRYPIAFKGSRNDRKNSIFLQHIILGRRKGFVTDHIDNDGTNNTRGNLRFVTQSQNLMRVPVRTASGQKGVYFRKNRGYWWGVLGKGKERVYLGSSQNVNEIIQKRKDAERKYCDEHPGFSF